MFRHFEAHVWVQRLVGSLIFLLTGTVFALAQTGPNVTVVNTNANPVPIHAATPLPVTGTLAVTGTPAVTVTNTPTVNASQSGSWLVGFLSGFNTVQVGN